MYPLIRVSPRVCIRSIRSSKGMFLNRGQDDIVRSIEERIAAFSMVPVGARAALSRRIERRARPELQKPSSHVLCSACLKQIIIKDSPTTPVLLHAYPLTRRPFLSVFFSFVSTSVSRPRGGDPGSQVRARAEV